MFLGSRGRVGRLVMALVARRHDEVADRGVVLVARVLVEPVVGVAHEWERGFPGLREHDGVLDRDLVIDRVGSRPRQALDDRELLARGERLAARADDQHRRLAVEVRGFDDQRVALEPAARAAEPLHDLGCDGAPSVDGHDARLVDELEANDDIAGCLHDLDAAVVHEREHRGREAARDAAVERVEIAHLVERDGRPAARHRCGTALAFSR